jgi:hypothetical protein
MSKALDELIGRLDDLEVDLGFVSLSLRLRPRLGEILDWAAGGDSLLLAREFMNAKGMRTEALLGPFLVRLAASLERYTRKLIHEIIDQQSQRARTFDDVSAHIRSRNVALTGTLLAYSESPRDHLAMRIDDLIQNLATCRTGSEAYRLNAGAFGAAVSGCGPSSIERALSNAGIGDWWDKVGANDELASVLGTNGARATSKVARARLEELWRWRNHLAHGGDEEVALTEQQLRDAINLIRTFAVALDQVVFA